MTCSLVDLHPLRRLGLSAAMTLLACSARSLRYATRSVEQRGHVGIMTLKFRCVELIIFIAGKTIDSLHIRHFILNQPISCPVWLYEPLYRPFFLPVYVFESFRRHY